MIYRKASTAIALRALKHQWISGRHNRRDMEKACALFRANEGREVMAWEVEAFVGI